MKLRFSPCVYLVFVWVVIAAPAVTQAQLFSTESEPLLPTFWCGALLNPYAEPTFRWKVYSEVSEDRALDFLGYTELSWNGFTAEIETKAYSELSFRQKRMTHRLGFVRRYTQWDCWVNHYTSYFWSELEEEEVAQYWEVLGWNQSSWDGDINYVPASEDINFADLSEEEQAAVEELCYLPNLWDGVNLLLW